MAAVGFGVGAMGAAYGPVGAGLRQLAWRTSVLPESIADLLGWPVAAAAASMAVAATSVAVVAARSIAPPALAWSWWRTGLALGAVGVAAWLLGVPSGRPWGLSVTGPARDLVEAIVFRSTQGLGWGAALLVGLPVGAWLSARCRGRVSWRPLAAREVPRRLAGGLLMGAGGTLAAGCNIGNALTGLSILSTNSALATAGIALGVATAVHGRALAPGRPDPVAAQETR